MSVGALSHFGYAEESLAAPGTLVARTKFFDPTSAEIDDKFPREAIPTIRSDRAQVRSISKLTEVNLSWESPLFYNALPFFFKMAMGTSTTTAAGTAYQHTFAGADKLKSFSAETAYDTAGVRQGTGFKVNTLGVKATAGEVVTCSCEAIGLKSDSQTAATPTLPSDDNVATFSFCTITFEAVSNLEVMSMELQVDNGVETVKTLNGTAYAQRVVEGVRKVTAGLEMDFTSQTMYNLAKNATKQAVVLSAISTVAAGGGANYYKAVFTMPNCKVASVSVPIAADGILSQKLDLVVMYDGGTSKELDIVVVNTDVSYPDVP